LLAPFLAGCKTVAPGPVIGTAGAGVDQAVYNAKIKSNEFGELCGRHRCDKPALLLKGAVPVYPETEYRQRREGDVSIIFDIMEDGSTAHFHVESTDGVAFTDAALAALSQWKFSPAMRDGHPVATPARQIFPFRLKALGKEG
jgi:protein TonB